jgi:2-polyprenyl-6-methoxyphenol hydroxylase-like FAD-dependent oxidoreductase
MRNTLKPDIAILGAGISGIPTAIMLKRLGYDVLLIEKASQPLVRFKGEYLQPYALEVFKKFGLDDALSSETGVNVTELSFEDLNLNVGIEPSSEVTVAYPTGANAKVLRHQILMQNFWGAADKELGSNFIKGADVRMDESDPHAFTKNPKLSVQLQNGSQLSIEPRWLIGCDGVHSTVRRAVGGERFIPNLSPVPGAPPQFIVGCEISDLALDPQAYKIIRAKGLSTFSFVPIESNRTRIYFNAPLESKKADWTGMLTGFLDRYPRFGKVSPSQITQLCGAPASSQFMGPAVAGNVFLAGDSIAYTSPLGGQGMNCAGRHVELLHEIFRQKNFGSAELLQSSSLKRDYEKEARSYFNNIMIVNSAMYSLFFSQNPLSQFATAQILDYWKARPEVMLKVGKVFSGLDRKSVSVGDVLQIIGISAPHISSKVLFKRVLKSA